MYVVYLKVWKTCLKCDICASVCVYVYINVHYTYTRVCVHVKLFMFLQNTVQGKVYTVACIVGVLENLILALNLLSILSG